jgi:hypothetical protein
MLPFSIPSGAGPSRSARPWLVRTALAAGVATGGLALSAQAADATWTSTASSESTPTRSAATTC